MALQNTGQKGFDRLRERNLTTGELTGVTKVNVDTDPDYVPPVYDPAYCEEGPLYIRTSTGGTNYSTTSAGNPFNIYVESNTKWEATPNFYVSFPLNNSGTHNGILTVDLIENTSADAKTRYFNITSVDGTVVLGITITQAGIALPPPAFTQTTLARGYKSYDPCNGALSTYYINGNDLSNSTQLYRDNLGINKAYTGYYSDGAYYRYWSGTAFLSGGFCTSGETIRQL